MTKAQIQKIILDLAGNPSSGAIKTLAPVWAEAISAELTDKVETAAQPKKETRVIESQETR